jgi:hypothetical protein
MQSQTINYWAFIEAYYPNYYSCNQVLLSDILTRNLEGEEICAEDEEMIKDWNIKEELLKLDKNIFSKALENYFVSQFLSDIEF